MEDVGSRMKTENIEAADEEEQKRGKQLQEKDAGDDNEHADGKAGAAKSKERAGKSNSRKADSKTGTEGSPGDEEEEEEEERPVVKQEPEDDRPVRTTTSGRRSRAPRAWSPDVDLTPVRGRDWDGGREGVGEEGGRV